MVLVSGFSDVVAVLVTVVEKVVVSIVFCERSILDVISILPVVLCVAVLTVVELVSPPNSVLLPSDVELIVVEASVVELTSS